MSLQNYGFVGQGQQLGSEILAAFQCLSQKFVFQAFDYEGLIVKVSCILDHLAPGAGCSKLTTSLVNASLKFQTLISQICQYFLLKKCEKLLHCKSFSHFFQQKISV